MVVHVRVNKDADIGCGHFVFLSKGPKLDPNGQLVRVKVLKYPPPPLKKASYVLKVDIR